MEILTKLLEEEKLIAITFLQSNEERCTHRTDEN